MSEQEKKTAEKVADTVNTVMKSLPEDKKEYVKGLVEGMALMAAKPATKQEA